MAKNNPNGANQYQVDPRQALFLANYLNPKSETFSNALQSALKAGYSQEYAESILTKDLDWLAESVGNEKMVKKAEKVIDEMLDLDSSEPQLVKIKQDTAKFVTSRLAKQKWSERTEVTGANGKDLPVPILQIKPQE